MKGGVPGFYRAILDMNPSIRVNTLTVEPSVPQLESVSAMLFAKLIFFVNASPTVEEILLEAGLINIWNTVLETERVMVQIF